MAQPVALCAHQQPVDDLPRNQRRQHPRVVGGVDQPDEWDVFYDPVRDHGRWRAQR